MTVETHEQLSIGRFARLSGLTVKALRHYDEVGLLRPVRVDAWTGYRYYAAGQAADAIAIRRLRELDLPLDEVAVVLRADEPLRRERLAVHRARLEGRVAETEQLLARLDRLIQGEEPLVPQRTIEVQVRDIPEIRLVVTAAHVRVDDMFGFVPNGISSVCGWLQRRGVDMVGPPLIAHLGIVDDALDVEVGWPVRPDAEVVVDGPMMVRTYPATRAAVHEHRGTYNELPGVYGPLEDWIRARGLAPGTPIRETYVSNPGDTPNEDELLTRIAWPVSP